MKEINFMIIIIMLFCTASNVLFAQRPGEPWMETLNQEFQNCEVHSTPIGAWEAAGSNAVIDTLNWLEIDITDIHAIVCLNLQSSKIDTTYFENAVPDDSIDDSAAFNDLIEFVNTRELNVADHIRIIIPPGVYNLSDQIVMHSNISLKGAGSDQTELRFLIKSDSIMTQADCRKDAIQINGSSFTPEHMIHNVGIEDLKIVRMRDELPEHIIWAYIKKRVDDKYPGKLPLGKETRLIRKQNPIPPCN